MHVPCLTDQYHYMRYFSESQEFFKKFSKKVRNEHGKGKSDIVTSRSVYHKHLLSNANNLKSELLKLSPIFGGG